MARTDAGSVNHLVSWEAAWLEALRVHTSRIIEEEAGAAANKVHQRIQELGAKLALQLSKEANIRTMGDTITIRIDTKGLEPLLRKESADAKVARLEDELDVALEAQARSSQEERRAPKASREHVCHGGPCSICGDRG